MWTREAARARGEAEKARKAAASASASARLVLVGGAAGVGAARRAAMSTVASAAVPKHALVRGGDEAVRSVAWWLGGGCAWVFSMVVLGGMTRLTRSGLSMTDWKFEYEHPPLTDEDWAKGV
jgi:cytochrome c oxidase assembly protein subunit 15